MPIPSETALMVPQASTAPTSLPEMREQVIEVLSGHFAADRISMDEFEHRVTAVYAATTSADVVKLVEDLKPLPMAAPAAVVPDALRVTPIPAMMAQQEISVVLGNHERGGYLTVPERLHIRCILGNVELDLRDATFSAPVTEITADAILGNVELTVPKGVRVESHGNSLLGSFDAKVQKGAEVEGTPVAVVRLMGNALLSSVSVKYAEARDGVNRPLLVQQQESAIAGLGRSDPQRLLP